VTRAAANAEAAADAVLAWLRDQSRTGAAAAPAGREGGSGKSASIQVRDVGAVVPDARTPDALASALAEGETTSEARPARRAEAARRASPMRLAHTDWLHHRLAITGVAEQLAAFRRAAAGAGIIPWQLDLDRMEEDLFHLLVAPPPPQQRTLSVVGARVLARQLRDAVGHRHERAVARVGASHACPFDLHALVPVPDQVLRLGPDDPVALAWLWEHWGTTQALRHAAEDVAAGHEAPRRSVLPAGRDAIHVTFWSADWTPWRALEAMAERWPGLHFDMRPAYGGS
jgi:hypothetical protein